MDFLPESLDWPMAFLEVGIRSDSSVVVQTIRDLPLGSMAGVSILAVSRAGRIVYDIGADFRLQPEDRLIIIGAPGELREADAILNKRGTIKESEDDKAATDRIEIAEIGVADNSVKPWRRSASGKPMRQP